MNLVSVASDGPFSLKVSSDYTTSPSFHVLLYAAVSLLPQESLSLRQYHIIAVLNLHLLEEWLVQEFHIHYYSITAICLKIATHYYGAPYSLNTIYLDTWLPLFTLWETIL